MLKGRLGRLAAEISETNAQIKKFDQQIVQTIKRLRQASLDELQRIEADWIMCVRKSREAENVLRRARSTRLSPARWCVCITTHGWRHRKRQKHH